MNRALLLGVGAVALAGLGYSLLPQPSAEPATGGAVAVVRADGAIVETPAAVPTARATPAAAPSPAAPADRIPDDPELRQSMFPPDSDPKVLYGRLRGEPIEKPWAERMQRDIAAAFVPVPYLQRDRLRVACATTLCEIRGREAEGLSHANTDVTMKALQGERLDTAFKSMGMERTSASFGGNGAMEFTMYLKRR